MMTEKLDVNVLNKFKSSVKDFFFEKDSEADQCLLEEQNGNVEENADLLENEETENTENELQDTTKCKERVEMIDKCVSTEDKDEETDESIPNDKESTESEEIDKVENKEETVSNGKPEQKLPRFRFQLFSKN